MCSFIFCRREDDMPSNHKPIRMIEAIYQITPAQLKNLGIEAVLTSLDNTLIAWSNSDGTEELLTWILEMRDAGIPVIVVSGNNSKRVARAIEKFDLLYVTRAVGPLARGVNIVKKQLDLANNKTATVDDQTMTNICGASRTGIRSILVKLIITADSQKTQFNHF